MDRNINNFISVHIDFTSLSARRAWIEIIIVYVKERGRELSLSARRAWIEIFIGPLIFSVQAVALRKESVDRNINEEKNTRKAVVALRKESVDRNCVKLLLQSMKVLSLSARRAWIEITQRRDFKRLGLSLSARRAWIEIPKIR